jgi:ubiquinone/menaquinone biosynthesis C-methylase UbiE
MNTIRSYEPEYNVQCFFRDLPRIREKTFTVRTIKHAFQNARIWPVSFKAVQRKLKEYGKKQQKDTGLEFLEFSSSSNSDTKPNTELPPPPTPIHDLEETYRLPTLPKPPSSYNEYVLRLDNLDNKILEALSSSPRKEYTITIKATKNHLMLRSLHEMDTQITRIAQVERHKAKVHARLSFQRRG